VYQPFSSLTIRMSAAAGPRRSRRSSVRFMRFEREKSIPALRGADWSGRIALRREAEKRDPAIRWISYAGVPLWVLLLVISNRLLLWLAPSAGLLSWGALYFAMAIPLQFVLKGLFITPRVRRALDSRPT
jgi:hypothetical protein